MHTAAMLGHASPAPVRRPTREPNSSAVQPGACESVTVAHTTGSGLIMHMNVWTTEGTSTAQGWATGESIHTMAVLGHASPAPVRRPTREPSSSAVRPGACESVTVAHRTGSGLFMH